MGKSLSDITVSTVFIRNLFYRLLASLTIIIFFNSCSEPQNKNSANLEATMNSVAEKYVKLVLNIGTIDPDYVDAYYGPAEWKPETKVQCFNK